MMLPLLLLILAGAQGNVGQERNMSENHQYGTLISVLKEVGHSLECFGDIVHESLSSHAESRDTLQVFGDLLRQSLKANSHNSDAFAELGRLSMKVHELEANYHTKNEENIQNLLKVHELEANYKKKNEENEQNRLKVQDLQRRLQETQELVDGFVEQVKLLNETVAAQKNCSRGLLECGAQQPDVKRAVEKYSETSEWENLKQGLGEPAEANSALTILQARNITADYISPLFEVARRGYAELVTLLLCHGLAVEASGYNRFTMLHGAAYGDQLRVAQLLVEAGADLESRDSEYRTPLMLAAAGGSLEVAQWLVKVGANLRATASDGRRAVVIARDAGHYVVAEYLSSLDP